MIFYGTANLSGLDDILRSNQLMANYISKELARGETHAPIYTPYIVAGVSAPLGRFRERNTQLRRPNGGITFRLLER